MSLESGTKLNLQYMIQEIMEDYEKEELYDAFKDSENFSIEELRSIYEEDEFSDAELRIVRIQFISDIGN